MSHSIGPFEVRSGIDYTTGGMDFAVVDADRKVIAEAFSYVGRDARAPAEANARLFAQAWRLLACCERVLAVEYCAAAVLSAEDWREMRQAVAEAKRGAS